MASTKSVMLLAMFVAACASSPDDDGSKRPPQGGGGAGGGTTEGCTSHSECPVGQLCDGGSCSPCSDSVAGCTVWEVPLEDAVHTIAISDGLAIVNIADQRVITVSADTGAIEFDLAVEVAGVAISPSEVFWSSSMEVFRRPRQGGDATLLAQLPGYCFELAVTSLSAFCAAASRDLFRIDLATGAYEVVSEYDDPPLFNRLEAYGDDLYFYYFDAVNVIEPGGVPVPVTGIGLTMFTVGGGAVYSGHGTAIQRFVLATMEQTSLYTVTPSLLLYGADSAGRVLFSDSELSLTTAAFDGETALGFGAVNGAAFDDRYLIVQRPDNTLVGVVRAP